MGKIHNIAAGIMMTGAILGIGNEAVSQNAGNSNSKANVGQVQDNTKKAIVDIDSLDHETIINMKIDDIMLIYGTEKGSEIIKQHMLIEVNKIREECDCFLEPLTLDSSLNDAAKKHSEYLNKIMTATHKGENNTNPQKRARISGYNGFLVKENVGFSRTKATIQSIIQQQKNSPLHLENLKDTYAIDFGFGIEGLYFTVMIGRRPQ